MKNVTELHADHTELSSEISFLKREIEFLLQMLRNGYSSKNDMGKTKLLDGYWKGFEENVEQLGFLQHSIQNREKQLTRLYQANLIDPDKTTFREEDIISEFANINKKVKLLKESFYDYMTGCCACCYKTPNS